MAVTKKTKIKMRKVSQSSKNRNKKPVSQADRVRELLLRLAPNVTRDDRAAYINTYGMAKSTVSKYLSGQVQDVDTALDLCRYFNMRILERQQRLDQLCPPLSNA